MILSHASVIARTDTLTRPEWLRARDAGLGGSDAAVVCGVSRWKSAFQLRQEKLGLAEPKPAGPAARAGQLLERGVAQLYAETTGDALLYWPVILRSREYPFMLANLDYLIVRESTDFPSGTVTDWPREDEPPGALAIYEGKTNGLFGRANPAPWKGNGIPIEYELQVQHYSAVVGLVRAVVCCLMAGKGLVIREREFEDHTELIAKEREFWEGLGERSE